MSERDRTPENLQRVVENYLQLGNRFESPPKVLLKLRTQSVDGQELTSRDIAVTTAVQCYAPGVAAFKERTDEKSLQIQGSTLDAGHHTTRMHTNYTWQIVGATRSVTHEIFHSYPFYNSEQQSQRYVEAKEGNYLVPKDIPSEHEAYFRSVASFENSAYFRLLDALHPGIEERVRVMYPAGSWRVESTKQRLETKANKLCQEVARYVLSIGQLTTFDHTLNEISLLRLFRASLQEKFPDEARFIIGSMISQVAVCDPSIIGELDFPLERYRETQPDERHILEEKHRFDQNLGPRSSLMLNSQGVSDGVLINSARIVLGMPPSACSDSEVLSRLMDPVKNKFLADVYETGMLDPLTTVLRSVSIAYATKLSHTADSQRQRQRRTPGATPRVEMIYDGSPDFITPMVIRDDLKLQEMYTEIMVKIFGDVGAAIKMGIPKETALLLLPNATTLRLVESGDLFDWLHRWKQRLCFTAQEEICFISMEQTAQLAEVMPESAPMLLAPCGIRKTAGVSPRCPEGDKWCGQPVYNWTLDKYKENRLI